MRCALARYGVAPLKPRVKRNKPPLGAFFVKRNKLVHIRFGEAYVKIMLSHINFRLYFKRGKKNFSRVRGCYLTVAVHIRNFSFCGA